MADFVELHAIVKGRVQGVGFRDTISTYAADLNICGTVRNLSDGSVEIYAQGDQDTLETFLDKIDGQSGAVEVRSIAAKYAPPTHVYHDFKIISKQRK